MAQIHIYGLSASHNAILYYTKNTVSKTALKITSNKNNQSDKHQHRRLFTFACGAIVSPNTLYISAAWGASRNAIHAFYSVAVRNALSLRSVLSLPWTYIYV